MLTYRTGKHAGRGGLDLVISLTPDQYAALGTNAATLAEALDTVLVGLAALMGYAFGPIPNAIWWGHPWTIAVKHVVDGVIYALVTAATFAWLWPAA